MISDSILIFVVVWVAVRIFGPRSFQFVCFIKLGRSWLIYPRSFWFRFGFLVWSRWRWQSLTLVFFIWRFLTELVVFGKFIFHDPGFAIISVSFGGWKIGRLRSWDIGCLRRWGYDAGILKHWKLGVGTLEDWEAGRLRPRIKTWNPAQWQVGRLNHYGDIKTLWH